MGTAGVIDLPVAGRNIALVIDKPEITPHVHGTVGVLFPEKDLGQVEHLRPGGQTPVAVAPQLQIGGIAFGLPGAGEPAFFVNC